MPYSEHSWCKLSKGCWEACSKGNFLSRISSIRLLLLASRSHLLYFLFVGLPKTVELKTPIGDEDLPVDSTALGKLGTVAREKKNKRKAMGSASLEK